MLECNVSMGTSLKFMRHDYLVMNHQCFTFDSLKDKLYLLKAFWEKLVQIIVTVCLEGRHYFLSSRDLYSNLTGVIFTIVTSCQMPMYSQGDILICKDRRK